jgi:hypothetical protein
MFVAIIAILMVFGIPLSAIIGSYYVKLQKMKLESGGGADVARRMAQLEAENRDLRSRVEVLETIVTSDEPARPRVRVEARPRVQEEVAEVPAGGATEAQRNKMR